MKRCFLIAALMSTLAFSSARAEDFSGLPSSEDSFETAAIDDSELDTMRGGAFNINGFAMDFSYFRYVSVVNVDHNINDVQQVSFSSSSFQSATPEQIAQMFQPLIVQNNLDNSVITALQTVQVMAPGAMDTLVRSGIDAQAVYSSITAARGL